MAKIKPFRGVRPPRELVEEVASRPYDVLNSDEARREADGNPKSLYHIIKPEIDFDPSTDEHDPRVYDKAVENFNAFQSNGWRVQDDDDHYYIYAPTMDGRTQYGLVIAANVDDSVFFAFPDNDVLEHIIADVTKGAPEYDFTAPDGFGHHFWVIDDKATIEAITGEFARIPYLYIADGHHRTAAAALVGAEKAKANPGHRGDEEYNYFLAVAFPASHLKIIDYNRVVRDLNGLTPEEFLGRLEKDFIVEARGADIYKPEKLHNFSLYLAGIWYSLTAREGRYNDQDPIGVLDVTISSDLILRDILGITDLRSDKRIDFVGGIRGLSELSRRVDSGEMAMALALYPVSMKQLMDIADSGNIMPPKTTWFEPKLRSGLVIHKLD